MLFNSLQFLLFFPVVAILYFLVPRRAQWVILLAASCFFYMTFRPVYILIPACTITVDYFAAIAMERSEGRIRTLWLCASLFTNLGVLCLFKYFNFFNQTLTGLLTPLSLQNPVPFLKLIVPIGLSFHVFRSLSYTIEVYRKRYTAERHFGIFALYVLFFPELIAGPIERPQSFLPQLHREHGFVYADVVSGLQLAMFGFLKKVMIADRLAPFVAQVYDHPRGYPGISLVLATVGFAFQLYCDFSGYTDVALGIGQIFGLKLLQNFDRPFFSKSIAEFWRRWHISLSSWLRDYVYVPVAIDGLANVIKNIALVEAVSLVITFLVSGLWHGAAWTYVCFGGLNGLYLATQFLLKRPLNKVLTKSRMARWNWPIRFVSVGFTFSLFCFTLILFRAANLSDALYIMAHLTDGWGGMIRNLSSPPFVKMNIILSQDKTEAIICFVCLLVLLSIHWIQRTGSVREILNRQHRWVRWSIYYAAIAAMLFFGAFNKTQQFIYVRF